MFKTRILVEGALFSAIAAIFQLIPIYFSEIFIFFTLVSTFPIYLITRKNVQVGITAFATCAFVIFCFSVHESIIFGFVNGLIGVSLGYMDYYLKNKIIITSLASLKLAIALCVVNFLIGIPVFGLSLKPSLLVFAAIYLFSFVYIFVYFLFIHYLTHKITLFRRYLEI